MSRRPVDMNLRGLDASRVWPLSRVGEELFGNSAEGARRSPTPSEMGEVN